MPIEPASPSVFAKPAASEQESAPALIAVVLVAAGLAVGGSVYAFAAEKQEGSRAAADCAASDGTAATGPPSGPSSGTAPGADGSTAWTGGTGGSYVGTTPGAPTPSSKTEQPATATGLDPTKSTTGSSRDGC